MKLFKINEIKKELSKVIIFSFFSILCLLLLQSVISAHEEFMPIDEIYSGMKGIGKTVFSGIDIEEFDVEVIDIISGTGINNSYLLVKLSGERIDENGGISAGMSGSPVYIDGKLVGAISHAWEMSEHNLC
ncbi:MAG: SpoIVB peptidase S55 domain-containing protein, partial [Atribacterota bacterium]